ncbi:hypothetical protein JCM8547_006996 [Rhodosporidiobolus lusitaniae]
MAAHPNNTRKRPNDHAGKQPQQKRRKGAPPAHLESDIASDPVAQEKSLKAYLHHALKLLGKAVKKSKTFELQKVTRKLRTAREPKEGEVDAAAVADLEAQLQAIKTLNLDSVPPQLLRTRLAKLPALRSASFLPSLLSSIPTIPIYPELDPQSAEGKARNRVLANKVVPEAWDEVVRAVRKRMGEEVESKGGKGKEKEVVQEPKKRITMDPGRAAALEKALLEGAGADGEDEGESSADEGPKEGFTDEEAAGSEGEDDDDAIARELAALNDGVGSEGEWSGSEDEDDRDEAGAASDSSFPISRPSASSAPSSKKRPQPSLSPSPPPASKKAKSAKPTKPITSSSFLPTLAGGYISYSDSDGEDAKWVKASEREDKKSQRKNRRGQRARQAIWEKKFGSAANHVVKSQGGKPVPLAKMKELKKKRANGTAPEPALSNEPYNPLNARGGSTNPNAQDLGNKARSFGGKVGTTGAAPVTAGAAGAAASGEKMHPSWEAKRMLKEQQALAAKPAGKKITFDD